MEEVVRSRRIDMIHAYEWRPCLQAAFSSGRRIPLLMNVMSTDVPRFLPTHLPIIVGTPELQQRMEAQGRRAHLLEPSVDMEHYRTTDIAAARAGFGIPQGALVISMVSMLTTAHGNVQSALEAIRVVDRMAFSWPVRLLVAGGGEGLEAVRQGAAAVNAHHGWTVVQPLGFQLDSSPVYEAADIVLGRGSSALKGLAHAKPLMVHGESGFWRLVDEETSEGFLHGGWYGRGGEGDRDLTRGLEALAGSLKRRTRLGAYGRHLVATRFDLERAAERLASIYVDTALGRCDLNTMVRSLVRSAAGSARYLTSTRLGSALYRDRSVPAVA
ncbi:glycosyl transferase family 1 [Citricoccus sp. NPDC055426]|uniref:glycosyl transferase family 1 n=1 Tax=Citricoccus sp. NPDC055426 TaxID=3155536 RepID=UPI00344130CF